MSDAIEPNNRDGQKATRARRPWGIRLIKYAVVLTAAGVLLGLLVMGIGDAQYAARKSQFQCSLKQFGLGTHNFHDTFGHFPPYAMDGSANPDVTQPISYHTILLPYLESNDWFDKVDMTIPWDAPPNREFYELDISMFQSPLYRAIKSPEGYAGTYMVPNTRLLPEDDGIGMALDDITDGAYNTILAGGIDDTAVPAWGDPENDRDPANGFAGGANAFGGLPDGGSQILMADGSVREVHANTSSNIAKALATPSGNETIPKSHVGP